MILITGAAGHIGHELIRLLEESGAEFRIMVSPAAGEEHRDRKYTTVPGDWDDPGSLAAAVKGADRVFLSSPAGPEQAERQGRLVEAARKAGVSHLVKLSSLGARLDDTSRLGRWHAEIERRIEASGLAYTHLRPHFTMQNMLMFEHTITLENAFYAPMGEGRIGLVDARDIAAVAAVVLTEDGHAGQAYDITGPDILSFMDVSNRLSAVRKRQVTYVDIPPDKAREGMLRAGTPEWLADGILELYASFRAGEGELATETVERVTGRRARSFDEFAVDYAEHFTRRKPNQD